MFTILVKEGHAGAMSSGPRSRRVPLSHFGRHSVDTGANAGPWSARRPKARVDFPAVPLNSLYLLSLMSRSTERTSAEQASLSLGTVDCDKCI
jgi:hypothetical protein